MTMTNAAERHNVNNRSGRRRLSAFVVICLVVTNTWWVLALVNFAFDGVLHLPWW